MPNKNWGAQPKIVGHLNSFLIWGTKIFKKFKDLQMLGVLTGGDVDWYISSEKPKYWSMQITSDTLVKNTLD